MNQINKKTVVTAKLYQLGILALVISSIFFVFSYWGIGYTTNDETQYERWALLNNNYFSLDTIISVAQTSNVGRIQIQISYYLLTLPHWLSTWFGYRLINLFNLVAIFTSLGLFSLFVYKVTQQKLFAIFIALFFLVAIQNSWDHNMLTSYTFAMNVAISLLLASLVLFLKYLSSGKRLWWGLSVAMFLLVLFTSYEFFLFYTAIFMFIAFCNIKATTSTRVAVLKTFYISIPYFISVVIFLLAYFIYRQIFPGSYAGLNIAQFSLMKILNVIYQYTVSSFPTYIYFHYAYVFDTYSDLVSGHNYTISNFVEHLKAEWLVKSVVVSYFVYVLLQSRLVVISGKMFASLAIASLYVMVVPNILVAITAKHQEWTTIGTLLYTTTYYSYFGTVLLIVSSIIFFNQCLLGDRPLKLVIRRLYILLITIGIAFISLATDYSNYYVFKDQKLSQYKWKIVDTFVQAGNLQNVPTGSFIYAPSLWQHHGIVANDLPYWSDYLKLKYKKDVIVSNSLAELKKRVVENGINGLYYLKFSQELKDYNQFILFAKIDKLNFSQNLKLIPLANKGRIFSNSKYRNFTVFGRVLSHSQTKIPNIVKINGINSNQEGNFFSALVNNRPKSNHLSTIISSNGLLDLESVSLSNYTDHQLLPIGNPLLFHLSFDWGKGFYYKETNGTDYWRWSEQESEYYLNNSSQKTIVAILSLKFVTPGEQSTNIKITGDLINEEVVNKTQNAQNYNKKITVPPGRHRIKFSTTAKQLVTPNDSRAIYFGVYNYRLSILNEEEQK